MRLWRLPSTMRALGAFVDQLASSATNFIVIFAAIHSLSISGVGAFTIGYTTALTVLSGARALVLEPLTVRFATSDGDIRLRSSADALGASVALGAIAGSMSALAGFVLEGNLGSAMLGLALAIPALLIQDGYRMALYAAGRPWAAALNDALCGVAVGVLVFVAEAAGKGSIAILLGAWGIGTGAGVLIGVFQLRTWPRLRGSRTWFSSQRDLGLPFSGELLLERGSQQLAFILVGVFVGLPAVGAIGSARMLMAPYTTLATSVVSFMLPEGARVHRRHTSHGLQRLAVVVSVSLVAAATIYSVALAINLLGIGQTLAGANWQGARLVLLPVAIWTAAAGASQGPRVGLRVLEATKEAVFVRLVTVPVLLLGVTVGSMWAGVDGGAWALAAGYMAVAIVAWLQFVRVYGRVRMAGVQDSQHGGEGSHIP